MVIIFFKRIIFYFAKEIFFRKDLFPRVINTNSLGIFKVYNDNFIDIGVPDDYFKLCSKYKSKL